MARALSRPARTGSVADDFPSTLMLFVLVSPPAAALLLYCLQVPADHRWQAFAVGGLAALAAAAIGAFLGFLFGVPKSLTTRPEIRPAASEQERQQQQVGNAGGFGANTNLEEISDWLTKILVGAGLVQLGAVMRGAGRLGTVLGRNMGAEPGNAAMALSLVIYGTALGFLLTYIPTRAVLPRMLREGEDNGERSGPDGPSHNQSAARTR